MLRLCITSDDFGADPAVNAAVEAAHQDGVLTAASLMVTGAAAADAVARARTLPDLGVGLHLVLVDGIPALPPSALPDLVGADGRFRTDMVRSSFGMLRPAVQAQLRAEITAQFEAFAATGLALDHANAHKHFHLHPVIGGLLVEIGKRFGLKAIRAPVEPGAILRRIEPVASGTVVRLAGWWARRARARFLAAGLNVPDGVFGLRWSGAMTIRRLARLVAVLPPGFHEIYTHPATDDEYPGHAPGYRYRDELAALCDPAVRAAVNARGARLGSFAALA
jgi:chitin disaccharide deacetylase